MAEVGTFYQSQYTGEQLDNILKNVYDSVPLDGSKPMTAPLEIKEVENGYTQLEKNHTQTTDLGTALRDVSKGGGVVALLLKAADQAARLQFGTSVYDLIHSGNIQPYVKPFADAASAASEEAAAALAGVRDAINNIPEGAATPIVNDLTTGGTSMALSAEMGKVLKGEIDGLTYSDVDAAPAWLTYGTYNVAGTDENFLAIVNSMYESMPDNSVRNIIISFSGSHPVIGGNAFLVEIYRRGARYGSLMAKTYGGLIYYRSFDAGVWRDFYRLATTDYAVPLDGSKAMTGTLKLQKADNGYGEVLKNHGATTDYGLLLRDIDADGDSVALQLRASTAAARLYFGNDYYNILHTGNKPSGSYTGNGSATERAINTGGIGDVAIIHSGKGIAVVTFSGASLVYNDGTVEYSQDAYCSNGVITIKSANVVINSNGVNYRYYIP